MTLETLLDHLLEARESLPDEAEILAIFRNPAISEDDEGGMTLVPVVSVDREDDSRELNLVTSDTGKLDVLDVGHLFVQLQELKDDCGDYEIYLRGDYRDLGDDWWFWADMPVIAWAINPAVPAFGLLAELGREVGSEQ